MTISGASLEHVTLSLSLGSYDNGSDSGYIDFSGCILDDASLDNIVQACISSGFNYCIPSLNIGGSCAAVSPATQDDIETLQALGWNVTYNS